MAIDYSTKTYEQIMERGLSRVKGKLDKREGSIIWSAIGPASAEIAAAYVDMSTEMDRAFPDTATDVDLTNKAKERGVFRLSATYAVRRATFEGENGVSFNVPIGSRFSGGDANYAVTQQERFGVFLVTAEEAGVIGNEYSGNLIPIDYISGLTAATISDVVIPGEDEETDESLYQRYLASLDAEAYGGNMADYREKVEKIPGVGSVKVFPVWNGGGTVKIVFVTSEYKKPDNVLVDEVQTIVDPEINQGVGLGIAPIGHVVTIFGAAESRIDVTFALILDAGFVFTDVETKIRKVIADYFTELTRDEWAKHENAKPKQLIIRISQIETRVLDVEGVVDITGTTINGEAANLTLPAENIPVLGGVSNETA